MESAKTITVSVPAWKLRTYFPQMAPLSSKESFASRFFGGVDNVRELLVAALCRAMMKVKQSDLDKMYGNSRGDLAGKKFPRLKEIIADPSSLTTSVFSRLAFPLGLKIDEVLVPKLTARQRARLFAEVQRRRLGVVATAGGSARKLPSKADQLNLIVAISAFREIDHFSPNPVREKSLSSQTHKPTRPRHNGVAKPSAIQAQL